MVKLLSAPFTSTPPVFLVISPSCITKVPSLTFTPWRPEATEEKEGYWGIEAWDTKTTDDEGNETTTRNVQLNEDVKREKVDSTNGTNRIEVSGGQDIALDLNGNTIYGAGYGKQNSAITVTGEDTSLTLKDEQGGGAIFGGNSSQLADGVVVDDGASFTMESGTITGFAGRHGVNVKDGSR